MAYLLAILVGLSGFILYMAAFFFPEVHRKNDFIWSGIIFFYALALWVYSGRITGGVLLGQVASVLVLGWLGWQTLVMRRQLTPYDQQTWVSGSGKSLGEVLFLNASQLGNQFKQRWEQLPLPAPLKGLPDQVGRTVGNLQTKPQPKTAPAPTKSVEGTPAEPRKVRKKPKTAQPTSAEAPESNASASAEPGIAAPQTGRATAEAAIAPPSPEVSTPAPPIERAVPPETAPPTPEDAIALSPQAIPSEPTAATAPTLPPATSDPAREISSASSAEPGTAMDPAAPDGLLTSAAPALDPKTEPDTTADIPFTPPPGTEPTAVAHTSEVTPMPSEGTPEAVTAMETTLPEEKPEPSTELTYVANTETTVPPLEPATGTPLADDTSTESGVPSREAIEGGSPEDVNAIAEPTASPIPADAVTRDNADGLPEAAPEPPMTPHVASLPGDQAEMEWEAMTQDLWGRTETEDAMSEAEEPGDHSLGGESDRPSNNASFSTPTAPNSLDLSLPDTSDSWQEDGWGEDDTEPASSGSEDWDMDWNEPPQEQTPIQPPPVQPIIEPEELTFADMVAAANRTLTPEDRIVVDVKAIAITDDETSPRPADNWDDWDEEDNDSWFDR